MNGGPPSAGRAQATLTEVVSVRFSEEELRRVQALAVILETTPNAVIRDACGFYLYHQVGTPAYRQAIEAGEGRALGALDLASGAAYDIWASGGQYLALQADGTGEPLTGDTPDDLIQAIRADRAREGTP